MKKALPLTVVRVSVEQKAFDPDAVDAQVYCINSSDAELTITFKSESFLTLDEENGDAVSQSDANGTIVLKPGEVRLIAEVAGWEWDGHVGIELAVRNPDGSASGVYSYDFKSGSGDYFIESLQLKGRIISPR